jgi:hypothetical protein
MTRIVLCGCGQGHSMGPILAEAAKTQLHGGAREAANSRALTAGSTGPGTAPRPP